MIVIIAVANKLSCSPADMAMLQMWHDLAADEGGLCYAGQDSESNQTSQDVSES